MEKVNNNLMRTSLYERHLDLNAKMLDFASFLMPISYNEGIKFEYNAVRNDVGIFDVSHMGIIKVSGANSDKYLNHILSNDILKLQNGKALYSLMCNEKGGIIDDLIVYNIDDYFILIVNASNKEKDFNWMLNYKPDNEYDILPLNEKNDDNDGKCDEILNKYKDTEITVDNPEYNRFQKYE